jgi:hypothetical protein
MEKITGVGLNGLAIRSWGDITAVAAVFALFIGVLQWGLKLETRNDVLQEKIRDLEIRISKDILPRADERISHHDKELSELRRRLNVLEAVRNK